ncbi:MAG: fibronectin type III domain-containing protein, partial [Thermoguttaceae bacterium]
MTVVNSIVSGNCASSEGGAAVNTGVLDIYQSDVVGSTSERAGGISNTGELNLYNSIVAGNSASVSPDILSYYEDGATAYYSLVGIADSYAGYPVVSDTDDYGDAASVLGTADSPADPRFAVFTAIESVDDWNANVWSEWNLATASNSPAVNTGSLTYVPEGTVNDWLGNARVVGAVDMGAYEATLLKETPSTVVTSNLDVIDPNDGYVTLREAIERYAVAGDTVTFAPTLAGSTVLLGKPLTFADDLTVDASALWNAEQDAPGLTLDAAKKGRAIVVQEGCFVTVKGLNVQNGSALVTDSSYAPGDEDSEFDPLDIVVNNTQGGGVLNLGALTMERCVLAGNEAEFGGALYSTANATLVDCVVVNNAAYSSGGAVYSEGVLTVSSSEFVGNKADREGGAVYMTSHGAFDSTIFADNEAKYGGALYLAEGEYFTEAAHVRFAGNSAEAGGGVYIQNAKLKLTESSVVQNRAELIGGGVYNEGFLYVSESVISNNAAGRFDGGISNLGGALLIYDSVALLNSPGDIDGVESAIDGARNVTSFVDWASKPNSSVALEAGTLTGADDPRAGSALTFELAQDLATATFQWYRSTSAELWEDCVAIAGATADTYVPTEADLGYYLRVVATGAENYVGSVTAASTAPVKAWFNAPSVQVGVVNADALVTLTGAENVSAWQIEYGTDPEFGSYTTKIGKSGENKISDLTPGVTYYFRVKAAVSGYANSDYSEVKSATVPTSAKRLSNLNASIVASTKVAVQVKFETVANASAYVLEYSKSPNFTSTTTKSFTSAGSKWITGLTSGATYYFRAKVTASGYSDSEYTTFDISLSGAKKVGTPAFAKLTVNGSDSVTAVVNAPSQAETYTVEYSKDLRNWTAVDSDSASCEVTGLEPETTYAFRVKALASGYDDSDYSEIWSASTTQAPTQLNVPTLAFVSATTEAVTLKIGSVEGATAYAIEYSAYDDFSNALVKNVAAAGSVVIDGLWSDTQYYFRVKATGTGFTDSEYSAAVTARLAGENQLDAPTLSIVSKTATAVQVKIGAVDNAATYVVEYSTSSDFANAKTKS